MMKVWILGAVSLWTICSFAQQREVPIYLDNNQPIEKRVEDALARMTLEEKAANLLYFITKNHSFFDGNKRIAATMFLYFLDKNKALFIDGQKKIEDAALVALTIMIAESRPEEKEMMISVVMNCMV